MAVNPFDYVKAINEKRSISNHSSYTPFLSNRAFSYNLDTILAANEMNKYPDLPPEVQFAFMNEAIRTRADDTLPGIKVSCILTWRL